MKAVLAACDVLPLHATVNVGVPFIMVGHSMGGMDQLLFTLKWPKAPSGLLLYGTGPGFKSDRGRLGWNKQARKIAASFAAKGLGALIGSDQTKGHTSWEGLRSACLGNYAQRDDDPLAVEFRDLGGPLALARNLHVIDQPTAILIGQYDKTFGRASEMMSQQIPHAVLYQVNGGGHMACEKASKEFNRVMFLALAELQQAIPLLHSRSRL
jgi:pimeloyl-ACP methyl ester carboxylesterase